MQLNDIRVPRAIFPRERYARSPKLGKSTLIWRHAIKHLVPPGAAVENTRILPSRCTEEIPLETQKSNKFSGGYHHTPDLTNVHD